MAFSMSLWEVREGRLVELPKQRLDSEQRLEEWVEQDPSLLGLDVLVIGRQVRTHFGGRIDLLALDQQGDVVIIQLKKDRTPREIVAQVLDYASWVDGLSPKDVTDIAEDYLKGRLAEKFSIRFGTTLPEAINADHRMLIVASELDDSSERIVQYLSSRHSLGINVVFFRCFRQDGRELVGRSWLMDPEEVEERSETQRHVAWSGYWFVNVGEGEHRNWDDCRKYGFIGAGQGIRYSKPLKKLKVGDKMFAYMKGLGYVGFGEVTREAALARDFIVDDEQRPLFDLPLAQEGIKQNADSPELAEWAVVVKWDKAFPKDQAKTFRNVFANQNIVCKLLDTTTLDFLKSEFQVEGAPMQTSPAT
jgi:hypothetical protein